MLKKLRYKFITINMAIVVIMLSLIFGLLYYSTYRNLERESIQMMRNMALNPMRMAGTAPDAPKENNVNLPYFYILLDQSSQVINVGGDYYDLTDENSVNHVLNQALETDGDTGLLTDYDLRFLRMDSPFGKIVVFSDVTSEKAILRNMIKSLVLIGLAACLIFFGISLLLARWAVRPVEEAWQQQKQFVADASHELKTPLTVILTDAELLHTPGCSEEEVSQLSGSIVTMSVQMRGLVESLLNLARIDSGSVKEAMSLSCLSDLISEAAMMFEPVFFEKEMTFSYDVEQGIFVYGNGTHLKQLADTLLDNAAKYASPGGETLLSLKRISSRKCLLSVSNQGEPIPEENLKNLFKRFYRVDQARTSAHSYGLGLAIADSIAHEHHGRIWAESIDGYNRFHVELPTD